MDSYEMLDELRLSRQRLEQRNLDLVAMLQRWSDIGWVAFHDNGLVDETKRLLGETITVDFRAEES